MQIVSSTHSHLFFPKYSKNFCVLDKCFLTEHQEASCKSVSKLKGHLPCPFTGPKMFCAGPNFLSQPKNLSAYNATSKTFCAGTTTNFTECKSSFCLAQNVCDWYNM